MSLIITDSAFEDAPTFPIQIQHLTVTVSFADEAKDS
jgi:hypothetical protein